MNAIDQYNKIAIKNGGYKSDARFTFKGISGEDIFKEKIISLLPACEDVLDAGCGHGAFTIEMATHTKHICGFDFAVELINIANRLKNESDIKNVDFFHATTKESLPFQQEQFNLIYDRRGPLSIADHPHVLKRGGTIIGIHGEFDIEELENRLAQNGFVDFSVSSYKDANLCFPNENDFARYLSANHMNPDYTLPENKTIFEKILRDHTINGEIILPQPRHIWSARRATI